MLVDWTECGKVLSGRALDKGESVSVFLIDEQTERLWETDRLQRFTPAPDRLGQWSWPIDFCLYINRTSDVIQAGSWKDGKWVVEGSSFSNRLWRTAQNIRAFTNCPGADNWVRAEPIHPTVSLKAGDVVEVMVRSEISGRRYRAECFRPLKDRLQPAQWAQDLAAWINKTFDMIRAGCPDASGQRIKETADKAGNYIWVPHNSRLTVSWEISEKKQAAQVLSGRDALEGERICAYLVDDLSGERLQSEDLVFKPAADRRALRDWVVDFCKEINKRAKNMRAGCYDDKGVLNVAHSFERNFIWTWRKGLRAFTTAPHLNNWVQGPSLLANEPMTVDQRVIVRVCNKANGAVWETLLFTPKADRLKPALWVRDLSTLINQQSLFVRAGQPNPDTQVIETIADVYRSHIWVPKHSELEVKWDRVVPQSRGAVTSDRDAVEGESISLFVMDEATGEILERPTYKAVKDSLGQYLWPRRFASEVNRSSRYVQVGDKDENGVFTTFASGYKNRIWTPDQRIRAFSTSLDLDNWVMARPFSFERDLKAGDRMVVHVRSELTGYLYQTLTFSPALKNNKATAADWTRALCEKLNKECVYLKAGCKNEKTRRIEPVDDHDRNAIWVPAGSGLAVEVLNIGDKTRYAAPIEVHTDVDAQQGVASARIVLGTLVGNDGIGPSINLGLIWSAQNTWSITGVSHLLYMELTKRGSPTTYRYVLHLSSGAVVRFETDSVEKNFYFSNFRFGHSESGFEVRYKNGVVEEFSFRQVVRDSTKFVDHDAFMKGDQSVVVSTLYLPTAIHSPTGSSVALEWRKDQVLTSSSGWINLKVPVFCMLERITSGKTRIFESQLEGKNFSFTLYPEHAQKVEYQLSVESINVIEGTLPWGWFSQIKRLGAGGVSEVAFSYVAQGAKHNPPRLATVSSRAMRVCFDYNTDNTVAKYTLQSAGAATVTRRYIYSKGQTDIEMQCGAHVTKRKQYFTDGVLVKETQSLGECTSVTEFSTAVDKETSTSTTTTSVTRKKGKDVLVEKALSVIDANGNIIKTVEKGITTELTYYPEGPSWHDHSVQKKVTHISSISDVVLWGVDNMTLSPFFSESGYTWETVTDHVLTVDFPATNHARDTFGLPVELECCREQGFFITRLESEKVYVGEGDARVDLKWKFYGCTALPAQGRSSGPVMPSLAMTILYPQTSDQKKLSKFTSASMTIEKTSYVTATDSKDFGRPSKRESCRLDSEGKENTTSRHETRYSYALSSDVLTTTITETFGEKLTATSTVANNIVTGQEISATDSRKNRTQWTYDSHGRMVSEVDNAQDSKQRQETRFQHHSFYKGHTITILAPDLDQKRVEYDAAGNQTKTWTRGAGFIGWRLMSSMEFDDAGRASLQTDYDYLPDGTLFSKHEQRHHYDDWGQLLYTELPGDMQAYCEHDPIKRQTLEYVKAGGKIRQKVLCTFDERGNLTRRELQDGAGKVLTWARHDYDAGDRLIKSQDSSGLETAFTYDSRDRLTTITEGGVVTSNVYPTHSGLVSRVRIGKDKDTLEEVASRKLNALSRVTNTTVGRRAVDHTYEGISQRGVRTTGVPALAEAFTRHRVDHSFAGDACSGSLMERHVVGKEDSSVTHVYSLRGILLSFTNAFDQKTVYHYDAVGRRTQALSDEVHNTLTYDAFGTLTEETVWRIAERSSVKIGYTHDALGQETARSFVIDDKHKLNLRYTYEKGRIKTAQLLNDTTSMSKEDYTYDEQGRLKTWTCDGPQRPTDPWLNETLKKQSFTYDVLGNIQTCISETTGTRKTNTATYTYSDTDKMQPTRISHSEKSCTAVDLAYDTEGRLTKNPVNRLHLHYDKAGRQVGSGEKHLAHYDSFGRRVYNEDHYYGECFYYNDNAPYARKGAVRIGDKKTCDHRRTLLLNESGSCVAQQQTLSGGGEAEINTFELKDIRGSVIASWRTGKEGFTYLPFTPYGYRPSREDDLHWLGFTGQPMDRQSGGVYHLGNGYRTYDPITLVFHAPDDPGFSPFGEGGSNWYAYCLGDPVNMVDPTGHTTTVAQWRTVETARVPVDPVVREVINMGVSLALIPFTGGGSAVAGCLTAIALAEGAAGIGAAMLQNSDPDSASALRWLQFGLGITEAVVSLKNLASHLPLRNGGRVKGISESMGKQFMEMGGNLRNTRMLKSGAYVFEDIYKGAPRLNVHCHGVIDGVGYMHLGNRAYTPEHLLMMLKSRSIDPKHFASIRMIMCGSANGGSASFSQRLATMTGRPVKGFLGSVWTGYDADTMTRIFAEGHLNGKRISGGVIPLMESFPMTKQNPFKIWKSPMDFMKFEYNPVHFMP